MPDPNTLRVGDRIVFTGLPEEWADPRCFVPPESLTFMRRLIRRGRAARVYKVDPESGAWIRAILRLRGVRRYHAWLVSESTGWRLVSRRGGK